MPEIIKSIYNILFPSIMDRITFGYHTGSVNGLGDLLGENIVSIREFLQHVRTDTHTEVRAWFSSHFQAPSLRIRIDGELGQLEMAMDKVIAREGLPSFADQPVNLHSFLNRLVFPLDYVLNGWRKPDDYSPTTPDAFELIKERYSKAGIILGKLVDGTVANTLHYS